MVGRARKPGDRHPSGKLVQHSDLPPAALERRRLLVGDRADDPRAGYPLGILYLRGTILHGDYRAGMHYAALHHLVWGSRQPKSHLAEFITGIVGAPAAGDDSKREARLLEGASQLGEANVVLFGLPTRRPFSVLENIAVYERPLRFMDISRSRSAAAWEADRRDLEALLAATDALARLWQIEREGSRSDLAAAG